MVWVTIPATQRFSFQLKVTPCPEINSMGVNARTIETPQCSRFQTSFPVIHKVENVDIFVQFLMAINWKCLPMKSILLQMYIYHDALN